MEEEIDLRRYVEVLLKYKFWIAGLAVLAVAVAFVVASRRPAVYEAQASLAMLRVRSEMTLEPKFITLSEEDVSPRTDIKSLRETLVTLVESPSVAAAVSQQLEEQLNGVAESIRKLQAKVTVGNKGDLITIQARDQDPQLAAAIANAWAQQAEVYVNSIYGQTSQPVQELQTQFQDVQDKYLAAQADLEVFLAQNQIPELEREVKHHQDLIAGYQASLTNNEAAVYDKALENNLRILTNYYAELANTERVLVNARVFYEELHSGGAAAEWSRALAFIGLQNRAFGVDGQQLQITLAGDAPAMEAQDVEQLIRVLEEKAVDVRAAIVQQEQRMFEAGEVTLAASGETPLGQRIQSLTLEMLNLQSQLEAESARQRELTQARDLAWEAYQTVARKLAEAEVAVQVPGSEVRLATQALRPERPVARGRLMNTAIAGMLGLMVGTFGAFAVEWWRQEPLVDEKARASAEEVQAGQVDG
jgi:succinoglycan biosynthesis transport protein ExoP